MKTSLQSNNQSNNTIAIITQNNMMHPRSDMHKSCLFPTNMILKLRMTVIKEIYGTYAIIKPTTLTTVPIRERTRKDNAKVSYLTASKQTLNK